MAELIKKMLSIDPDERPTTEEIIQNKTFKRQSIVQNLSRQKIRGIEAAKQYGATHRGYENKLS